MKKKAQPERRRENWTMVNQSETLYSMEIDDSPTINLFDQGKQLSIIELFELYFPKEIIQEIVEKTNQNYEQKTINKNNSFREEKPNGLN